MSDPHQTTIDLSAAAQERDHLRIREVLRRQCQANGERDCATLPEDDYGARAYAFRTTVGAVATEAGFPARLVAQHLSVGYLVVLEESDDQLTEAWTVMEDGE